MDRFPQFTLDGSVRGVYQKEAGFVDAGKANAVHVALAKARGATVLDEAPVYGVRTAGDGIEVETAAGTFSASKLVVAAGAWTRWCNVRCKTSMARQYSSRLVCSWGV